MIKRDFYYQHTERIIKSGVWCGKTLSLFGFNTITLQYLVINSLRGFSNGYSVSTYISKYLPYIYSENPFAYQMITKELDDNPIILRSFSVGNSIAYYAKAFLRPQEKTLSLIFHISPSEKNKRSTENGSSRL